MNPEPEITLQCDGPDAVTVERMLLRIEERTDEECRMCFEAFHDANNCQGRDVLDVAAAWILKWKGCTTASLWREMSKQASFQLLIDVPDRAKELLLLALEYLVRNKDAFKEIL